MSLSFHVAVEAESWPSFHDLNAAIAARGYPLKFLPGENQSHSDPFAEAGGFLSTLAEFRGEEHEMEVYRVVMDDLEAEEFSEILEQIGSDHRLSAGMIRCDYSYGPRIQDTYLAPYHILAGVLCLDFGGYGFEGQAGEHGGTDYGTAELREADRILDYLNRTQTPQAATSKPSGPASGPTSGPAANGEPAQSASRKLFGIIPVNFWTILGGLLLLLLLAEFVDKNIWNFTGTGGP